MKIKVVTIGSPALSFAKEGIAEYQKRLSKYADVEFIHIKEDKEQTKKVIKAVDKSYVIFLDEKGKQKTSRQFSDFLNKKLQEHTTVSFVLGGPDGHSGELLAYADELYSLGQQTLPHDLALLVLTEGLYRSFTIACGHPYHRG